MLSFSARYLPLAALFAGLAAGCAPKGTTGEAKPPAPSRDQTVTSDDLQRVSGEQIEKVLMSRVPGLWVTRTSDGGIAMRIRGASSIHGSNQPLFVLDGIVFEPGPGGSLTGINPYDIESIQVLKDPADISMYGARGANGVIIIKTKRQD